MSADERGITRYKTAVGLAYEGLGDEAPSISVKGNELIAARIVAFAERYGVPVVEKPELAAALSQLDPDQEIPEELFEPVAVVLSELR